MSTCIDDPVFRDDDIPAKDALLNDSQLPAGSWTSTTSCRWSTAGQDLLSIPECAALTGDATAAKEQRTGYARATWVQKGGVVRFDHRSELYGSPRKPQLVQVVFASPGAAECFKAVMQEQTTHVPNARIREIEVTSYDVGLRPPELGVDFVGGVSIAMTIESNGTSVPMAIRIISLRAGGGLVTMTLTGEGSRGSRSDLDAIDLAATVRLAATNLLATFGVPPP